MTTALSTLLPEVREIARAAGTEILAIYAEPFTAETKADGSPVTAADHAAHHLILARLRALTPDIPVISEESRETPYAVRRDWPRFWCVDPLDGTREFVKRNGEFSVNIALVEQGQPVLGVVYAPVLDLAYAAYRGGAAAMWKAGTQTPLHANHYAGGGARVAASRSHRGPDVDEMLRRLEAAQGPCEIVSMGSALKFGLVAEGRADVYPRLGPTGEWDTAAAQCVVEAAGGRVLTLDGKPLRYNKPSLLNPWFLALGAGDHDWLSYVHGLGPTPD